MKVVKRLLWLVFSVVISGGLFFAVTRSQNIIDWWKLRDYSPSVAVETLAANAGFNDLGRKLFYVHDPVLLDKESFSEKCVVGEETIVLGCYISGQNIYLFDVQDDRLDGVEEVTAAHEMLHAAFDRLSPTEQDEIGQILIATFNELDNERIEETIRTYEQRDNDVVVNELHSILATEVRDLPGPLEEHYRRYFDDRLKVVAFAEVYAEEFEKRERQAEQLNEELERINGEITRLTADMNERKTVIDDQRDSLEALIIDHNQDVAALNELIVQQGSSVTQTDPQAAQLLSEINEQKPVIDQESAEFESRIASYNADVEILNQLIGDFNSVVEQFNAVALERNELTQAIDTRIEKL